MASTATKIKPCSSTTTSIQHSSFDRAGIVVAVLCALHCLMVPVVLPTLALMGLSFIGMEWLETLVLSVSLVIGGVAVLLGWRHHKRFSPLLMLTVGGLLLIFKHEFAAPWQQIFVVLGALGLIGAHTANLYLCRKVNGVPCEEVPEA